MLKTIYYPEPKVWPELCRRLQLDSEVLWSLMSEIFDQVSIFGDEAVRRFINLYEGVSIQSIEVPRTEIDKAGNGLPHQLKEAILTAKKNIETFH